MHREDLRRGFSIYVLLFHQNVVLEIDFAGALWGYTDILIVPNDKSLRTVHLHCRQCTVHSVTVASHRAEFVQYDSLANLTVSNPQDVHTHPELKRKLYSALAEGDEGELSIAIPKEVPLKVSGSVHASIAASEAATPEPQTPGTSALPTLEFAPLIVHIEYSVRNPADGLTFVRPSDAYPYRVPHVYTTPSSPDAARCWVPCIDSLWERCTWDFEFVVPRSLEDSPTALDEDAQSEHPTLVICSGELVEQVAHPYNSNKTIFTFSQATPTSVQHIGFAAGPFHILPISAGDVAGDDPGNSLQPFMHAFCLPGRETQLAASVPFVRQAMTFFTTEFGSYPFGSHKFVFVDELSTLRFDTSGLTIVSVDLLHSEDAIDQVYETRQSLSHALACQWVGINILPKTWSDLWLVNGLGLYITGLFLRKLLGNNEYRFRLKKDMERVVEWDQGAMPPVCQPQIQDPPDSAVLPFINLKSPLVLHILDRRLCKSGTSLGLSRVLPKLFLSAISGELQHNTLSTSHFLRTCRKVSGADLTSFADQWIYGSGCPTFGFSASFNRKKMAVEITMRQDAPAWKGYEHDEVRRTLLNPVPFFEGQMTIRIHEADGTPYEHVLDIRTPFKRYEVPFNTKYKRVRRNTKRYLARQAAAQAAAEGDAEAAEAMGMIDMGFGLEIWEKEKERENWKVADWTEDDEQVMSGATYEWIRMDADFEWIATIEFTQPDFMWVSQLQRDRDVVAQLEAVRALSKMPNAIVSSTFTKTVLVTNYFFRVRCEATLALVTCAYQQLDFLGLFHLFKLFLRYCYDPDDAQQDLFTHSYVPRPNDFSDISEYFVRRSIVKAVSQVRFANGKSPTIVRQFLIDQLKYNDNTANSYTDAFYICTIISALACASVSIVPPERGELFPTEVKSDQTSEEANLLKQSLSEVDRYRSMDRLIPSPHNVVTIATLEFRLILSVTGLIPNDPRVYFPLTREGNYTQVRVAAFDALFLTKWYTPKIMRYILAVAAGDSSRTVRHHVARNACQSLALLVSMGELKNSAKETESLLIEEDGSAQDKAKETKKSEVDSLVRALRKDKEVGKNEMVREFLLPIALAPNADQDVRWSIIKLADVLVRGAEEAPPKLSIHLPPPTPVTEIAPPLPAVKIPVPPKPRTIKPGGSRNTPIRLVPSAHLEAANASSLSTSVAGRTTAIKQGSTSKTPASTKIKVKAKNKEAKAVPKAQSGGMASFDLKACRTALQKLKSSKHSNLFLQPVDPVRDRAPNYFEIIKNPMDISAMNAKLEEGMYKERFAFEADFRLMIRNAKTYNMPGWARINNTIDMKSANQPKPMPPPPLPIQPKAVAPPPKTPATPTASTGAAAPTPTLKLKIGGNLTPRAAPPPPPSNNPTTPKTVITVKPKGRKVKPVGTTPAPVVDDGSFDLLEEVIAIEKEKEKLVASMKQRQSTAGSETSASGKRKKDILDELEEDEEILGLASPSKKPNRSPQPVSAEKEGRAASPAKFPGSIKIKKPPVSVPEPAASSEVKPQAESRPPSNKGKEKEVASPAPARSSAASETPINKFKAREILKALLRLPEAIIFSRPVDPIQDGCPTYFDEIKNPMDFGTMMQNLNSGKYSTMEEITRDVELVFSNCRLFNPPTTYPVQCVDVLERAFKKEWARIAEKKMPWSEKRSLQSLMTTLAKDSLSFIFREPVDPIALGIPQYHEIIPRKDARDLRTIRQKLDADKYETVEGWEADIELMIRNAIHFNGEESEVGQIAVTFGNRIKELRMQQGVKKRRESERPGGDQQQQPATKKAKLG
ncbi:TATA-binding protein associated factor Taf2 [Russula dissimulans]|nr:TATA-binding protein associated factor Taf2 [Russula dissimulans]